MCACVEMSIIGPAFPFAVLDYFEVADIRRCHSLEHSQEKFTIWSSDAGWRSSFANIGKTKEP